MKVNKLLNEASVDSINTAKSAWDAAQTQDDKLDILNDFLRNIGIGEDVIKSINNFGFSFVEDWVKAMRWDELGRNGNDFVALLKDANSGSCILTNKDNFTKIYNCYASSIFNKDYLDDEEYQQLIYNSELYSRPINEIKSELTAYARIKDKLIKDGKGQESIEKTLRNVFFENGDFRKINSHANIASMAEDIIGQSDDSEDNNKVRASEEQINLQKFIDDILKNPDPQLRSTIIDYLNNQGLIQG